MMRQSLVFPPFDLVAWNRLRDFEVVVEADDGTIWRVMFKARQAPDNELLAEIAGRLAGNRDPNISSSYLLDTLLSQPRVFDTALDDPSSWNAQGVISEAIAGEVLVRCREGDRIDGKGRAEIELRLQRNFCDAVSRFVGSLNAKVVAAARSGTEGLRPSVYNFLAGGGSTEISRNRLQIFQLFPLLMPYLIGLNGRHVLIQAIDNGKPFIDAAAEHFWVMKSVIRGIREITPEVAGREWTKKPWTLIALLGDIAPEHRPRSTDDWRKFNAVVDAISHLIQRPLTTTRGRTQLRASARRGYRLPECSEAFEFEQNARNIDEMVARLTEILLIMVREAYKGHNDVDAAIRRTVNDFLGAHDIFRLGQIARKWQAAFLRAQTECAEDRGIWLGVRWPAPIDIEVIGRGFRVVPLLSPAELLEEGAAMQHCVASYSARCLSGLSQIFSIRIPNGGRVSTVETEIKLEQGIPAVRIVQHRGSRNQAPSTNGKLAASALISAMRDRPEGLAAYVHWRATMRWSSAYDRKQLVLIKPIKAALEASLPKVWSLPELVRRAHAYFPIDTK